MSVWEYKMVYRAEGETRIIQGPQNVITGTNELTKYFAGVGLRKKAGNGES